MIVFEIAARGNFSISRTEADRRKLESCLQGQSVVYRVSTGGVSCVGLQIKYRWC